jgi:cytochrome c oxidase subunit 4
MILCGGVDMKLEGKSHTTRYRTYVIVWLALILLTGLTYTTATSMALRFTGWAVLIALSIAGTKSVLVLGYFMHLKSERELIFKIIIPLVVSVFLVFVALTFSDVAFRIAR